MSDIRVTGPDGSTFNFPVGTGASVIEGALKSHYSALQGGGNGGAASAQEPVAKGDWAGLKSRLDAAEQEALNSGPTRPQDIQAVRQSRAREEGFSYGRRDAATTAPGRLYDAAGQAANTFALKIPRLAEAYMPGFLGGQSELPGAEAHEFIKSADEGRANVNQLSSLGGRAVGAIGQSVALPIRAAGMAGWGANALVSALLSGAERAVETRGDVEETAKAAGFGGIVGGVGSAAAEGIIKTAGKAFDPLKGLARAGSPDDQAAARLALAAKAEGATPATIAARKAELGPDMMLADALGASGESMVRTAGNVSPAARRTIEEAYLGRQGGQTDRLVDVLLNAGNMPARRTVAELSDAAAASARPKINEAYDAARTAGFDMPQTPFQPLYDSPMFRDALNKATAQTADRTAAFGGNQASQFAVYDAARQLLANQGFKEGDEVAKGLARKLNATVDENLPEAFGARSLAADLKRRQEALELGAAGFGKRAEGSFPREIAAKGLPPRPEISQGYAAAAIEELAKRGAGKNAVDQLTGSQNAMEALKAALGGNADEVLKKIAAERHFMSSAKAVLGGPDTARKLTEIQLAGIGAGAGSGAGYLAGFDPTTSGAMGAALMLGKRGIGKIAEARRTANEAEVAPTIAALLTGQAIPKLSKDKTESRVFIEALLRNAARAGSNAYSQSNN